MSTFGNLKEAAVYRRMYDGFSKIYKAMEQNGSAVPTFKTDEQRNYFLATLLIHSRLKVKAQAGAQAGAQAEGQAGGQASKKALNDMEQSILEVLAKGPSSRDNLLDALVMDKRTGYFRRMIDGIMDKNFIAYTYPDTPRHPDQKYKITQLGKQYVE